MTRLRLRKLIKPRFQLKIVAAFVLLAAISVLLQAILLGHALGTLAELGGEQESRLLLEARDLVVSDLLLSFAVLMPLFLAVGILVTFRIAGPLYRLELHFRAMSEGKDPGPCRLRKNDELHDLCDWINRAHARLRSDQAAPPPAATAPEEIPRIAA